LQGFDTHLIWGDSTAAEVIEKLMALGPFDAIFIDANHTSLIVEKDWANYGPMGRIVAFHDIGWHRAPEWKDRHPDRRSRVLERHQGKTAIATKEIEWFCP
jgi:predicted O-methyltransferase YrrM